MLSNQSGQKLVPWIVGLADTMKVWARAASSQGMGAWKASGSPMDSNVLSLLCKTPHKRESCK